MNSGKGRNERLQVTELNLGAGVTDSSLWKLTYHYGELNADGRTVDAAKNTGNIAMQTVSFAGLTEPFVQTYRYDSLYRITEARETNGPATNASQNWKETFDYDRYGNRTAFSKFTGTTQLALDNKTFPSIDPTTNRFNPNQGYGYDKNGNLISDAEGRSFVFNGENKQARIIKDGKLVGEYDYNGEGQRIRKRTYDANGALQETTVFVYSAGKLVAEYTTAAPPTNPTTRYTATDMLGSPRVIMDSQGNVISRRDFKPFGEEITNNTGERAPVDFKYGTADNLRQKFTTYQRDEETGLDFAEARMYENRHGRFTAVDPLLAIGNSFDPQTFCRFTYVGNNPLIYGDPQGLQAASYSGPVYMSQDGKTFSKYKRKGFRRYDDDPILIKGTSNKVSATYQIRRNGWTLLNAPNEVLKNKSSRASSPDNRLDASQRERLNSMADHTEPIPRALAELSAIAIAGGVACAVACPPIIAAVSTGSSATVTSVGSVGMAGVEGASAVMSNGVVQRAVAFGGGYVIGSATSTSDPSANGGAVDIRQQLVAAASKFGPGQCDPCAKMLKNIILESGGSGSVITLQSPTGRIASLANPGTFVSSTGMHKGVLFDGNVYDNLSPEGMPLEQWLRNFV